MAKLLHLQASPHGDRSASLAVAKHFIEIYRAQNPGDTVETLDVWQASLPEFNGATLAAKYAVMSGKNTTPEEAAAWRTVTEIADRFKAADKYLVSLPMWNFGLPYKLKQYIDVIVQPGLTFSFSPDTGYKGLVTGKPAVAVYARGGAYGPGTGAEAYDQQSPYLKQVLGFIGITNVQEIFVEPTGSAHDEALSKGKQRASELARAF